MSIHVLNLTNTLAVVKITDTQTITLATDLKLTTELLHFLVELDILLQITLQLLVELELV